MPIKTNLDLASAVLDVAHSHKTLYVLGCIGAPLTSQNLTRYTTNTTYNTQKERVAMIKAACDQYPRVYGFDCVCLIKSLLWGWYGDASKTYGGAVYTSNSVPDIGADQMISVCKGVSTDFSKIEVGEAVWLTGHIGVYVGNGLVVECTPKWQNGVQVTALENTNKASGMNARTWTKHGKLPYISYVAAPAPEPEAPAVPGGTVPPTEYTGDNPPDYLVDSGAYNWITRSGLVIGDGNGNFDWGATMTKAMVAQLLYNYYLILGGEAK